MITTSLITKQHTLNLSEAAAFLGAHKETIRRLAASGEIPGAKIGRGWRFLEQDLAMYMRNKYSTCDASWGVDIGDSKWHSRKKMGSGGSTSPLVTSVYAEALGLK